MHENYFDYKERLILKFIVIYLGGVISNVQFVRLKKKYEVSTARMELKNLINDGFIRKMKIGRNVFLVTRKKLNSLFITSDTNDSEIFKNVTSTDLTVSKLLKSATMFEFLASDFNFDINKYMELTSFRYFIDFKKESKGIAKNYKEKLEGYGIEFALTHKEIYGLYRKNSFIQYIKVKQENGQKRVIMAVTIVNCNQFSISDVVKNISAIYHTVKNAVTLCNCTFHLKFFVCSPETMSEGEQTKIYEELSKLRKVKRKKKETTKNIRKDILIGMGLPIEYIEEMVLFKYYNLNHSIFSNIPFARIALLKPERSKNNKEKRLNIYPCKW